MKIVPLLVVVGAAGLANADLIISEVVDGPLAGGNPKFVEITNTGNSAFTFTGGGVIVQSNDSPDTVIDVDLTGIIINPGQSYVIASSANDGINQFQIAYGFNADLYTAAFFGNGDDRYLISDGVNLLDIYGTFGSRAPADLATYNYTDSYAYRLPSFTTGDGMMYMPGEWFVAGPDALEVGGSGEYINNLRALTTPGSHEFVPSPAAGALLTLAGVVASRRRRA